MYLKHVYSLVLIFLLFHDVALQKGGKKENSETENSGIIIIDEGDNNAPGEQNPNEKGKGKPSEEGEGKPSEEGEEKPSKKGEGNEIEQDEKNSDEAPYEGKREISERKPATFHWPSGMVPYKIQYEHFDAIITDRIRAAMHTIMRSSCVVFEEKSDRKRVKNDSSPWLSIENPEGVRECSHTTLREEGPRSYKAILIVGYDCMQSRDILHGLLHALGFEDEVTHPQRDLYIRVVWPNIQPKYRSLFYLKRKEPSQKMVEYDSMSVMHFHDRAYTINGGATILPQIPGLMIAPSDTLTQLDVMKLRLVFGHECNKRKVANLLRTCQKALKKSNRLTDVKPDTEQRIYLSDESQDQPDDEEDSDS
ncbi:hypothetical protein PYW08_008063 [Mythimna loreyi]|uniref:Uncharacterized protein n=1 Tax=Mythimna loreyi TaxID=667449 RepID=A0ACC2QA88_9NEOP|nr:hypothetical protein PYW08_008063 [Mythimna loreyi]